jgi:hypothetical protein
MKTLLIAAIILLILFVVFQSFMILPSTKTEEQKYTVIQKGEDFEIRFYPAATIATISSGAKTYKELANPGFRKLAGYIFGGNETDTKISMTAPVHMDINDSLSSMSFVMPSGYDQTNLPKPNDSGVSIKTTGEEYVAALRFGGFASDKRLKKYSEKLKSLLESEGISTKGNYKYLGYNPPFRLVARRNEIVVSVVWEKNK